MDDVNNEICTIIIDFIKNVTKNCHLSAGINSIYKICYDNMLCCLMMHENVRMGN